MKTAELIEALKDADPEGNAEVEVLDTKKDGSLSIGLKYPNKTYTEVCGPIHRVMAKEFWERIG